MVQLVIAVRVVRVVRLCKVIGVIRVIRVIEEAKAVEGERRAQGEHLGTPKRSQVVKGDIFGVEGTQWGSLQGQRESGRGRGGRGAERESVFILISGQGGCA